MERKSLAAIKLLFLPNAGSSLSLSPNLYFFFYKTSTNCFSLIPLSHPQVSALHPGLLLLKGPQGGGLHVVNPGMNA